MKATTIETFYTEIFGGCCPHLDTFLEDQNNKDIGHFNVFDIEEVYRRCKDKSAMPYNRRMYYKISLIKGKNRVEYADKVVEIDQYGILFATPRIPYRYVPADKNQAGHFCVFTREFMVKSKSGIVLDDMPIFKPGSEFVFTIHEEQYHEIQLIFEKMHREMISDYAYKYDLLRNYVIELIHLGQKQKPAHSVELQLTASSRISALFIELLERQFPIETPGQALQLRTAQDFAETLSVHVNHLNKVLKDMTGKTTTEIIAARKTEEAKILLKQTSWTVSEIANSLGFEEVSHFSNFFKKQTRLSPAGFRE